MKIARKSLRIASLLALVLFTLGPILWCLVISISPESEMFNTGPGFLPTNPTLNNYRALLLEDTQYRSNYLNGMTNSLKAVALTEVIGLPVCVFGAYALSRFEFRFKRMITVVLLITSVIPVFATIIPIYKMFSDFQLLDNIFWISMIYVSAFMPMVLWILINSFQSFPKEIEESAKLDRCSRMGILFKMILPNSYPIILTIALLLFLMTWNQFQIPLILSASRATKPLSIVVQEYATKDRIMYGLTATAGMLALMPPAIMAVIFQKYLVSGLTSGSVKG